MMGLAGISWTHHALWKLRSPGRSSVASAAPTRAGVAEGRLVMGFRSEGFVVFKNGLTDAGLEELHRLSKVHEAQAIPTIAGRSWGECQLKYQEQLREIDVVTPGLKREIEEIGFAKSWQVLAQDFAHPH